MTSKHLQRFSIVLILLAGMLVTGYSQNPMQDKKTKLSGKNQNGKL